jgi:beta-galactosidase
VRHPRFALAVDRANGLVRLLDPAGGLLAEGPFAHGGRRFTESELLRLKNHLPMWSGVALAPEKPTVSVDAREDEVVVRITGRFSDPSGLERTLVGGCTLRITPGGAVEVVYEFSPEAGSGGILLEAGVAWRLPVACENFRWLGEGPDAGYPGADALNEYGRHHLQRDDIRFQGNRRGVEAALFTDSAGAGLFIVPAEPADIAVQRENDGLIISHNALVSGRGTKQFAPPETIVRVEETPRIAGQFTLVPVGAEWPAGVQRLFGSSDAPPPTLERPFYHSYDQ